MEHKYRVTWKIDIWAANALDAAREALEIQRDPDSIALVFTAQRKGKKKEVIDLWSEDNN